MSICVCVVRCLCGGKLSAANEARRRRVAGSTLAGYATYCCRSTLPAAAKPLAAHGKSKNTFALPWLASHAHLPTATCWQYHAIRYTSIASTYAYQRWQSAACRCHCKKPLASAIARSRAASRFGSCTGSKAILRTQLKATWPLQSGGGVAGCLKHRLSCYINNIIISKRLQKQRR
ncbi:hypothetical protein NPIL_372091 [Nephila pilipes]|uniref:Uncharacterized protein n=1 Tax=Nephila pilipes TaxID=299642 RepID=A0A8X6N449_NEPPI|nr:hypothetical protein NPIL_372091 [Nephila pilipes]